MKYLIKYSYLNCLKNVYDICYVFDITSNKLLIINRIESNLIEYKVYFRHAGK